MNSKEAIGAGVSPGRGWIVSVDRRSHSRKVEG